VESPSLWAFPFVLILHTVGLAFFVGPNLAWDLRVLGFGRSIPLERLAQYFVVMWIGFWVNMASGILLLIAYPTKALTNPLFYVKLALITAGVLVTRRLRQHLGGDGSAPETAHPPARLQALAATALACWVAVIAAGRFLAYTCSRLTVDSPC
jgi:hypothetical protein